MDDLQSLGQCKRVTVELDTQGAVILRSTDLNSPFTLSPDEAIDLLRWLFERQEELALSTPTGKLPAQKPQQQPKKS